MSATFAKVTFAGAGELVADAVTAGGGALFAVASAVVDSSLRFAGVDDQQADDVRSGEHAESSAHERRSAVTPSVHQRELAERRAIHDGRAAGCA